MTHATGAGQTDAFYRPPRFDQPLGEPAVTELGAKKVTRPHHNHPAAFAACHAQTLLQLDAYRTFSGEWVLRRVFPKQGKRIGAPLETVWKIQTDINAWIQWRPTVTAARFDGVLQAGSAFRWEEGGLKITSTVLELLPMRRIVWTGPAQGIDAVHVWEFTASEHGVRVRTEESWSGDVVGANAPALQPVLDGALQDWLARLKSTSEGSISK